MSDIHKKAIANDPEYLEKKLKEFAVKEFSHQEERDTYIFAGKVFGTYQTDDFSLRFRMTKNLKDGSKHKNIFQYISSNDKNSLINTSTGEFNFKDPINVLNLGEIILTSKKRNYRDLSILQTWSKSHSNITNKILDSSELIESVVEKERKVFHIEVPKKPYDLRIHLDRLEFGNFIEIQAKFNRKNPARSTIEEAGRHQTKIFNALGINSFIDKSYYQMQKELEKNVYAGKSPIFGVDAFNELPVSTKKKLTSLKPENFDKSLLIEYGPVQSSDAHSYLILSGTAKITNANGIYIKDVSRGNFVGDLAHSKEGEEKMRYGNVVIESPINAVKVPGRLMDMISKHPSVKNMIAKKLGKAFTEEQEIYLSR